MTEIDIGKALKREQEKEQKERNRPEPEESASSEESTISEDHSAPSDNRHILIGILIIAGLVGLVLGGFKLYDNLTSAEVVNVDELHQDNLAGDLDEQEGYIYNGYSFVKADGLWWTEMRVKDKLLKIPLHFGPREVEDVKVAGTLKPEFNLGTKVYITIDPNLRDKYYTLAISELSFNMVKGIDRLPIGSCTEENWACENRTIVSCAQNPDNLPVVEMALADQDKIELGGNCIKVSGRDYGVVKAVDRLLYQWYGIMNYSNSN